LEKTYGLTKTELVGLEAPQDIVELTLWTARVKNEKTVSVNLLGEPESGKTELMKKYRENPAVHVRRMVTAYGIVRDLLKGNITMISKNKKSIGHLMIYDLTGVFSYRKDTINKTILLFNALMEEGLSPQSAYWIDSRQLEEFAGATGGVIAGVNTFGFFTKAGNIRSNLLKGGYLSRVPTFSYDIGVPHLQRIFDSIRKGKYHEGRGFVDTINFHFPEKPAEVHMTQRQLKKVENLAKDITRDLNFDLQSMSGGYKQKGIRLHKSFISLVKASALRDERKYVMDGDIKRLEYLSQWMNLGLNPLQPNYPKDFERLV
jgi:hypothetical protein